MTRTIGVVGLMTNENVGDYLLVEATKYLLRTHDPDTILVDIDVDPAQARAHSGLRRVNYRVASIMKVFERPVLSLVRSRRFAYLYHSLYWRTKLGWYFADRIKDVDAVVFTGGGFIKFKTQGLNYIDELILSNARRRGIPVMMNAVGVEGYSETDIRCQRLKSALNAENVKVITTRDDIDTLDERYMQTDRIVTERVGDPVFWLNEMDILEPRRPREPRATPRIGINLLNPKNFSVYGGQLSPDGVVNFYRQLITELRRADADFALFSNGMKVDQDFGQSLVAEMNLRPEQLLHRPTTSAEFVNVVGDFDIILSARMHAGITAYALDVPVVGLIWGEKLQFLTEITGLRDRYFTEQELDPARIARLLVDNDLPDPDYARRDELRERTRRQLVRFLDDLPGGRA